MRAPAWSDGPLTWRIFQQAQPYSQTTRCCNLCLWENYHIIRANKANTQFTETLKSYQYATTEEKSSYLILDGSGYQLHNPMKLLHNQVLIPILNSLELNPSHMYCSYEYYVSLPFMLVSYWGIFGWNSCLEWALSHFALFNPFSVRDEKKYV